MGSPKTQTAPSYTQMAGAVRKRIIEKAEGHVPPGGTLSAVGFHPTAPFTLYDETGEAGHLGKEILGHRWGESDKVYMGPMTLSPDYLEIDWTAGKDYRGRGITHTSSFYWPSIEVSDVEQEMYTLLRERGAATEKAEGYTLAARRLTASQYEAYRQLVLDGTSAAVALSMTERLDLT